MLKKELELEYEKCNQKIEEYQLERKNLEKELSTLESENAALSRRVSRLQNKVWQMRDLIEHDLRSTGIISDLSQIYICDEKGQIHCTLPSEMTQHQYTLFSLWQFVTERT